MMAKPAIPTSLPFIVLDGEAPHFNLKFDASAKEIFHNALSSWPSIRKAAEVAGVCYQTVYNHYHQDAAFAEQCHGAVRCGVFALNCLVMENAISGPAPDGKAPDEIEFDKNGFAIIDARRINVDLCLKLIGYHDGGNSLFGRGRTKNDEGRGRGGAADTVPATPDIASPEETDAVLAEVIAKFDAAAKQKRHEDRERGKAKRAAQRAVAQAKQVAKRRAAKKN